MLRSIFLNIQTMARTLFPQDIPSQRVTVMKDEASNSIILIGSGDNVFLPEEYVERWMFVERMRICRECM